MEEGEPEAAPEAEVEEEAAAVEGGEVEPEEEERPRWEELLEGAIAAAAAAEDEGAEGLAEGLGEVLAEVQALNAEKLVAEDALSKVAEDLTTAKDMYLRLNADFDNFRKRSAQEKEDMGTRAQARTLEELLPVIDNFQNAQSQLVCETEAEQKIHDSYQGLYRQMGEICKKLGLEAVEAVGQPFDPELHEAIMREESDDVEDGAVLEEFRRGFTFKGSLLRAAMVKVAMNSAPPPTAEEGADDVDEAAEEDTASAAGEEIAEEE